MNACPSFRISREDRDGVLMQLSSTSDLLLIVSEIRFARLYLFFSDFWNFDVLCIITGLDICVILTSDISRWRRRSSNSAPDRLRQLSTTRLVANLNINGINCFLTARRHWVLSSKGAKLLQTADLTKLGDLEAAKYAGLLYDL